MVTAEIDLKAVGRRIQERKKDQKISKTRLALDVGCSKTVITRYENGETDHPSIIIIEAIAKVLKVPLYWLCYGDSDEVAIKNQLKNDLDKICGKCKSIMSIPELKLLNQIIQMQVHVSSMRSMSKKLEDDMEEYYQSNLEIST